MPHFFLEGHKGGFPDEYKQLFFSAWKAIESGNLRKFVSLLDSISAVPDKYPKIILGDRILDVCLGHLVVSKHTRDRCHFFMSLLAYAALNNQKEMVDKLVERKACTWISAGITGSPLTQMMIYCLHHGCPEMIDEKMVKHLINCIPNEKLQEQNGDVWQSNLDRNVAYHIPDKSKTRELCCPVELAIQIQRIDIAKQLVQAGADPICSVHDVVEQIIPLFIEFFEFGTNHYMSWLLHEHLSQDQVSGFIEKVLEKKAMIFSDYAKEEFKNGAGRHHVHAALTCGHEEMIKTFVKRFPIADNGQNMLKVKDLAERTALQIAAANGDSESVIALLKMYSGWVEQDDDGIDIAKALLVAAKANHIKVVDIILKNDDDAFQDDSRKSVLHVQLNGEEMWKIAVQEGLSSIFESLRHYNQSIIDEKFDSEGNTLGHIAALNGNVDLFKVVFPLHKSISAHVAKGNSYYKMEQYRMFWALVLENDADLTPLMVAIDNNHHSILETLQERTVERELRQNAKQSKEKTEWEHFWTAHGKNLLVYACSCGSSRALESVKVLINITKSTLGLLPNRWTVDALEGSVRAGNDDVVNYFLQNFKSYVSQELKDKVLLEAADFGHHRCVRILLKHGADIKAVDESDQNNCLIKAIEKNHREAVLTILCDERFGPESLCFLRKRTQLHVWRSLRVVEYTQPLILLTKHMPEIAEWVLNKCALSKQPLGGDRSAIVRASFITEEAVQQVSVDETDFNGGLERLASAEEESVQKGRDYIMQNKFELLELPDVSDYRREDEVGTRIFQTRVKITHPVQAMVDYDRSDMLNHNLVQTWIDHKLRDAIPDLVIYLIIYLLFLALLTIFALLLPRPGPSNKNCYFNETSVVSNTTVNGTSLGDMTGFGTLCEGQSSHFVNLFYFCSVLLILFSVTYLALEVAQLYHRVLRYLKEIENYVQVVMYITVIIFVFPVGHNSCWCLPAWKWQVGALALFLAWLNLLLLIRYIPWLRVGQHSTMLFNVYINFLELIYLPVLLLVTFAIPLYMLLVDSTTTEGREVSSVLTTFASPFTTLYNVVIQTVGEVEARSIIYESSLHYEVASYTLFLVFVIAVPILFNNFLTAMAVGETQVEQNRAYLSLTKRKIYFTFEVQNVLYRKIIPFITKKFCKRLSSETKLELNASDEKLREFRAKDKSIKDDIKAKTRAKSTKRNVKKLTLLMNQNQSTLNSQKIELEHSLQTLRGEVADVRNEMADVKESMMAIKGMMHQLCVSS